MKTAIEQAIEKIKGSSIMSRQSKNDAIRFLKELLEVEKQGIIDAYNDGAIFKDNSYGTGQTAEQYYTTTFKK